MNGVLRDDVNECCWIIDTLRMSPKVFLPKARDHCTRINLVCCGECRHITVVSIHVSGIRSDDIEIYGIWRIRLFIQNGVSFHSASSSEGLTSRPFQVDLVLVIRD